jgi:hypothetical protein
LTGEQNGIQIEQKSWGHESDRLNFYYIPLLR